MSLNGVRLVVLEQHLVFSADRILQDYYRFTELLAHKCTEISLYTTK